MLARIFDHPRIRAETGWVVAHKLAEFALLFVELKVFTLLMGAAVFAEFRLVLTGALLIGYAGVMPMQQAYLRYRHAAEMSGDAPGATRFAVRWLAVVTVGIALCAAVVSAPLSRTLGFETWTLLAGGLVFLGNRWRVFWIQLLEFRRQRRANTIQNVGFLAAAIVLVVAVLSVWSASAAAALSAYALTAAVFGAIGLHYLLLEAKGPSANGSAGMRQMLFHFGVPFGGLMICQWLLNFAERYILGIQLDLHSVGVYIAAYIVCGVPYLFALSVLRALLTPIAYQRCTDRNDPRQLWSADTVLFVGVGLYLAMSVLTVPAYFWLGPRLLPLLTTGDFVLPGATMLFLAMARALQCLGPLLEAFFAVHECMFRSLGYRVIGSLAVVPICWYGIKWYGVSGAALGILVANAVYLVALCAGPGGCLRLLADTRNRALEEPDATAAEKAGAV